MKTEGLQSFRSLKKSSFLDQATRGKSNSSELSGEEEKMISSKFNNSNTPLEFYEGSGSIRKEQPSSRGSNIDITV